MNTQEVNEKIKAGVVFEQGNVFPKWFFWGRRKILVQSITHTWRAREGETPLLFFAVTDGANVYEIRFNQKSLEWRLEKIYVE